MLSQKCVFAKAFEIPNILFTGNKEKRQFEAPLLVAICFGYEEIVEILLKSKANAKESDENGDHLLHFAALRGDVRIAKLLLKFGADVNAMNKNEHTPLFNAIYREHVEMAQCLIDAEASLFPENWTIIESTTLYLLMFEEKYGNCLFKMSS